MSRLTVHTAEGLELEAETAGVGSRLLALMLDLLIVLGVYIALGLVAMALSLADIGLDGARDFVLGFIAGGCILGTPVLYFIVAHVWMRGRTPGKSALGLRLASADGYPASLLQIVIRSILFLPDCLALPLPIGAMLVVASSRDQRLGDMAAGTVVLFDSKKAQANEPGQNLKWAELADAQFEFRPGMAARIEREDLDILRDLLSRRELPPRSRRTLERRFAAVYSERLGIELDLKNPQKVGRFLRELYLFARDSRS